MLNITNFTVAGDNVGMTYTSSYSGSDLPSGLTWEEGGFNNGKDWTGYKKQNGQFARQTGKIGSTQSQRDVNVTFKFVAGNGEVYYYYIRYNFAAHTCPSACVTPDTLVTLADGTQKMIKDVQLGENIIAWNFYTGEYEIVPVSLIQTHETGYMNVIKLYFDDGTELKIVDEHGVFDAESNTFVYINESNVDDYVGHNFVKKSGDTFAITQLVSYEICNEYTTAYTIYSFEHYNVVLENMFTQSPPAGYGNFFYPFDITEDMKFDEEQVKTDIEKYGLYTYEDFAEYVTYEQFVALKFDHFKVSVGKGLITYEGIIELVHTYVNNEDFNVNN